MSRLVPALRSCLLSAPLLMLAACASLTATLTAPPPIPKVATNHHVVTLTPRMTGSAVTIGMDQELEVKLDNEPVHSLRWFRDMTTAYADRGVLAGRPNDPGFERERLDVNTFGGAGFDIWRFTPKTAGEQVLRFEYRYAGTASGPVQVATYTITVR